MKFDSEFELELSTLFFAVIILWPDPVQGIGTLGFKIWVTEKSIHPLRGALNLIIYRLLLAVDNVFLIPFLLCGFVNNSWSVVVFLRKTNCRYKKNQQ